MCLPRAQTVVPLFCTVFGLAPANVGQADAPQITQLPMVWNDATYTCVTGTFGQPDARPLLRDHRIPVFLGTRQIVDQYHLMYKCPADKSPAMVDPPPAGQALVESFVWKDQAFACTWVGQVSAMRSQARSDVTRECDYPQVDSLIQDGYVCSQAGQ